MLRKKKKILKLSLGKTQVQFLKLSILGSQLNLNIFEKDNIVCVSLVNTIMCLNSIEEPNVYKEV